jgi:alpha-tubulin suppressor-like RCC1 family protein
VLVVAPLVAVAGTMAASCSSDPDPGPPTVEPTEASVTAEAGVADASDAAAPPPQDASKFEGGPLAVVCASASCATALVTTLDESFCALLSDHTVACWGQNDRGQLGRGDDAGTHDSANAARVAGLSGVVSLDHTCATDQDGATWCWGTGPFLRSDAGATTTELTPVKLPLAAVTKLSMSSATACAVVGGDVLCWGSNLNGQIAAPSLGADPNAAYAPQIASVPSGAPIRDLVVGSATFVVRADGTALSWGANPPLARTSSLFPDPSPAPIVLEDVASIDVAGANACATANGVAYCWGSPLHPAKGSPLIRALPERVALSLPVVQIATATSDATDSPRACACDVTGAVYCWGSNANGQVGDGTKDYAIAPVKVVGLPSPAAQVRTTRHATCALLIDGTIDCWGDDTYGQLANGHFATPSVVPTEIVLP